MERGGRGRGGPPLITHARGSRKERHASFVVESLPLFLPLSKIAGLRNGMITMERGGEAECQSVAEVAAGKIGNANMCVTK